MLYEVITPVVVDVETGGFNPKRDALLEIAAVILAMNPEGQIYPTETIHAHVEPFPGANIEPSALEFTGIDPYHPFRFAVSEREALDRIFQPVRQAMKENHCVITSYSIHYTKLYELSL